MEPWGPERDSWHAAQISAACVEPWSKYKVHPKDRLLKFGPKTKPTSLSGKLRSLASAIGAKVKPKKR